MRGHITPFYGPVPGQAPRTSYPITGAAFTAITGMTASALYVSSGTATPLVDVVNARNLTAVSTPVYRNRRHGRNAVYADSTSDGFAANVNDPVLNSAIVGGIFTFPSALSGLNGLIGRQSDTTFPCIALYRNGSVNYLNFLVRDAVDKTTNLSDATKEVVQLDRPLLILGQIDRTNNLARLVVADAGQILQNTSGSIATHVTFTGGTNPAFCVLGGNFTVGGAAMTLGFYLQGAQCEGATVLTTLAKRLGYGGV